MRVLCVAVLVACVWGGGATMMTLYDWDEPIYQMHISNMTQIVAYSEYAWFVKFYSSWCGHCQRLAPVFTRYARDVQGWSSNIRVGAIACNEPDNADMCRVYGIWRYPTFKFIHPHADERYEGFEHTGPKNAEKLRRATIDYLQSLDDPPEGLPQLAPYSSIQNLTDSANPEDFVFAFVEGNGSNPYIGRMVAMDFSNVSDVVVGRIIDEEGVLVHDNDTHLFHVSHDGNLTLLAENRQGNISRAGFVEAIHEFINDSISAAAAAAAARELEAMAFTTEEPAEEHTTADSAWQTTEAPTTVWQGYIPAVYQQDLDSALYYTLYMEVAAQEIHAGLKFARLTNFLRMLTLYYPGTENKMEFLQRLYDWILTQEIGVDGDLWREYLRRLQLDGPYFPEEIGWANCLGSEPRFGGYPCGLWQLLHALTVNAYLINENVPDFDPDELLGAIRDYIDEYFSCRDCADHFIRHTRNMLSRADTREDLVWLMWRVHNGANLRLSGDITEDPERPKMIFPTFHMCPACRDPVENVSANAPNYLRNLSYWHMDEVVDFLVQMYEPENIREGGLEETLEEQEQVQVEQNVEDGNVLFEPRVKRRAKTCKVKVTPWSECSHSCGGGVSTRMSNDNADCRLQTEQRLCQMRPCSLAEVPAPRECEATLQSAAMSHFEYAGCSSVMTNQWRYCNRCAGQLCTPTNEMTLEMGFNCGDKQAFFPVQWILECTCEHM